MREDCLECRNPEPARRNPLEVVAAEAERKAKKYRHGEVALGVSVMVLTGGSLVGGLALISALGPVSVPIALVGLFGGDALAHLGDVVSERASVAEREARIASAAAKGSARMPTTPDCAKLFKVVREARPKRNEISPRLAVSRLG